MFHQYTTVWATDGDYVALVSFEGGRWVEHTRWLIPGTELED